MGSGRPVAPGAETEIPSGWNRDSFRSCITLRELLPKVLSLASDAEVLEPDSFREAIAESVKSMAAHYQFVLSKNNGINPCHHDPRVADQVILRCCKMERGDFDEMAVRRTAAATIIR